MSVLTRVGLPRMALPEYIFAFWKELALSRWRKRQPICFHCDDFNAWNGLSVLPEHNAKAAPSGSRFHFTFLPACCVPQRGFKSNTTLVSDRARPFTGFDFGEVTICRFKTLDEGAQDALLCFEFGIGHFA